MQGIFVRYTSLERKAFLPLERTQYYHFTFFHCFAHFSFVEPLNRKYSELLKKKGGEGGGESKNTVYLSAHGWKSTIKQG